MYETYIPVISKNMSDIEKSILLTQLKRINPDIVYLCYLRPVYDEELKKETIENYKKNKAFLEENGFETGIWVCPTIGYGGYVTDGRDYYQRITDLDGKEVNAYCPLDDDFCKDIEGQFKEIAKTGVKNILLEDEFTLTGGKLWVERPGCACEHHMKKLSEILNKDITREEIIPYITSGEKNEYREAYCNLMGETLLKFANVIEKAVHSIDESIRIGFSSNSASYHIEGVDSFKIAKVLAGKNKPFMRITAAPYWHNGPTLNSVIEAARLQNVWCIENGTDAMTEGDTYPRPRNMVSAAYLEMYDMILQADGNSKGILKYMLDYTSKVDFETGYVDRHILNKENYAEIEKRFSGMKTVGLEVFEKIHSIKDMDFDEILDIKCFTSHGILPLLSQWFVTDNSIPTTYEKSDGAMIVFGTNAQYLSDEDLKRGLIIDAKAAKILNDKGIDVGFESFEKAEKPNGEFFIEYDDITPAGIDGSEGFFDFKVKENAKILSNFCITTKVFGFVNKKDADEISYPSCYLYENKDGQRFMVYTFSPWQTKSQSEWNRGLLKNYYRQRQITENYEWLAGKKLPAVSNGNPGLYILCKKDDSKLVVGLWNIFPDEILNPVITVDDKYKNIDTYKCSASIYDDKIKLDAPIAPYSFVSFTLSK